MATFNGWTIVDLPCDKMPRVTGPSTIEWDDHDLVASSESIFTGEEQVYDWMASYFTAQISFPPMTRESFDAWSAFISLCRGKRNAFQLGDPKARNPKGRPRGVPVVNGAGQTGYILATRGWTPSLLGHLLGGDFIQIGYRFYKVTTVASSDSSGNATFGIWPPLRDLPADGTAIQTHNCKGLFHLQNNSGNKRSTNVGNYGLSGFAIKEVI